LKAVLIPSRRKFLNIGCRSLASLGAASFFNRFGLMNAMAQSSCPTDYKALVCVFFFAGNDGNNTIIPIATPNNTYAGYAALRQVLALPQAQLPQIATSSGALYGMHPRLTELQQLYNSSNLAVMANVGPLRTPLTRAQYLAPAPTVPLNLFSHSDQQLEWQSAIYTGFATTGWAGRVADVIQGCNAPSTFPTIVSVGGNSLFATGQQSSPATVTPGGQLGLQGFGALPNARYTAFQQLLSLDNGLSLVQASNHVTTNGINDATMLGAALTGSSGIKTVFPATSIGQQLLQVAKIIQVRSSLMMKRQIFFVTLGGFDTHNNQINDQNTLFSQVSPAMAAFYNATVELGVSQQVTTFTESDFCRTCQPSSGAGSDHAWGNHHFILGGAVKGGDIYGKFPTLAFSTTDDAGSRGVWIPTTALDQYGATLASWFGVSDTDLATVFPNLSVFKAAGLPANLGFMLS